MKQFVTLLTLLALSFSPALAQEGDDGGDAGANQEEKTAMSEDEKAAYALGLDIGQSIGTNFPEELDFDVFIKGIRDGFEGNPKISPEEANEIRNEYMQKLQQRRMEEMQEAAVEAQAKGSEFLEENKQKEGVKVTDSGLQYQVLDEGAGESPDPTDTVEVHYKGMLLDGTVFDSSYDRGEPTSFPLNRVIPGWTEGLQLMKPGAKYKFFIPPDLAYGQNPPPGSGIPPNAVLIFEVELLDVMEGQANAIPEG